MSIKVLGVDVGGTFTDFVILQDGHMNLYKLPSTPKKSAQAVLQGIQDLNISEETILAHGSTVATNALLERRGASTALITTEGFEDIIEIGRQHRDSLYDLFLDRPTPLVDSELRFGLMERIDHTGQVVRKLEDSEIRRILNMIRDTKVEAVAIVLLFSFLNPEHELAIKLALAELKDVPFLSVSSEILPEYREYERTSTVVANAYLGPVMSHYLDELRNTLGRSFRVMQSSGGSISSELAATQPVRTVLSGPAGGVVGAHYVASTAGYPNIITLDMGGTSTDVSLCPGRIQETTGVLLGGVPIAITMTDIHTVGAGGGSIARIDDGGALVVGPDSAGASPGPACYGVGNEITVTDAKLLLGHLDPNNFLGGQITLNTEHARTQMESLVEQLQVPSEQVAQGILEVVNSNMERALRTISLERGFDPRSFALVPFGGAGPMHACDLAESLEISTILIPTIPGVLSALGVAIADIVKDYSKTILVGSDDLLHIDLNDIFQPLEEQALFELSHEGLREAQIELRRLLDLRYVGQSYELSILFPSDLNLIETIQTFHLEHKQRYGHSDSHKPVELVNIRLKAIGKTEKPLLERQKGTSAIKPEATIGQRQVIFGGTKLDTKIYARSKLRPGNRLEGPSIVLQMDTTTVISPKWRGEIDSWGNLILQRSYSSP